MTVCRGQSFRMSNQNKMAFFSNLEAEFEDTVGHSENHRRGNLEHLLAKIFLKSCSTRR